MNEQLLPIIQAFIIGFMICGLFIIIGSSIMSKREKHRAKKGDKWSCQIAGHSALFRRKEMNGRKLEISGTDLSKDIRVATDIINKIIGEEIDKQRIEMYVRYMQGNRYKRDLRKLNRNKK